MGEATPNQPPKEFNVSPSDALALHPSDHPSLILVAKLLEGDNYGQWSCSMKIALSAKNKLGFIDGTIKMPTKEDLRLPFWARCNHMVLSWILNSVHVNISDSVIYAKTAVDVWNDLHDRFSQGNNTRIYQIRQEISELRQGLESVSIYYTKLKALWDELSSYRTPPCCTCGGLKNFSDEQEKEKVMQFLMGLNDSFTAVRGSILMMNPLPDTRKTHAVRISAM
ncbi:hypothetical protein UlMin_004828 [Ulmus minor]